MTPLIDLTGRKILITGASRGIGREISVLFSKLGAVLCLTARGEDGLRETVSMLEGEGHSYYPFDFSKPEGIADFAEKVCRESGPCGTSQPLLPLPVWTTSPVTNQYRDI